MQQRLVIFLLLPLILLLFGAGLLGFLYARNIMLEQWEEAAILKLQRAAHDIDMRLNRPFQLVEILNVSGGLNNDAIHQKLLFDQLENLEGVTKVRLEWSVPPKDKPRMSGFRTLFPLGSPMLTQTRCFFDIRYTNLRCHDSGNCRHDSPANAWTAIQNDHGGISDT